MCEGTGDLQNHERDSWPCPKCAGGGPAPGPDFVTITRDLHELYKEAAEEWAKEQTDNALHSLCVACKVLLDGYTPHRSNCRAARILGLKREVEK